jgi:HAD superfamily hydrolase (TIGR01509 family)
MVLASNAPSSAPLRAIVFDIGRVIVGVNYDRAIRTLSSNGAASRSGKEFWSLISSDPRMRELQEGCFTPRQWHEHLNQRLDLHLTFEEFIVAWESALDPVPLIPDEIFADLAARHRMLLLSNTDPIHVAHMEKHFSFMKFFPTRIYSCAIGLSKPDPAIYRRTIEAAAAQPEEILYVDDVVEYVEAGSRAGLRTIHFRDADSLRADLHCLAALR